MVELSKGKENIIKNGRPSGLDLHPEFVAPPKQKCQTHDRCVSGKVVLLGYRQDMICRTKSNLGYIRDRKATNVLNNLFCHHNSVTAKIND